MLMSTVDVMEGARETDTRGIRGNWWRRARGARLTGEHLSEPTGSA